MSKPTGWASRSWPGNDKTFVDFGAVITAFVTFMITAAVVYFIFVAPMNRINHMVKKRLATAEPDEQPVPADTALLAEIRDLLTQIAGPEHGRTGDHTAPERSADRAVEAAGERSR